MCCLIAKSMGHCHSLCHLYVPALLLPRKLWQWKEVKGQDFSSCWCYWCLGSDIPRHNSHASSSHTLHSLGCFCIMFMPPSGSHVQYVFDFLIIMPVQIGKYICFDWQELICLDIHVYAAYLLNCQQRIKFQLQAVQCPFNATHWFRCTVHDTCTLVASFAPWICVLVLSYGYESFETFLWHGCECMIIYRLSEHGGKAPISVVEILCCSLVEKEERSVH